MCDLSGPSWAKARLNIFQEDFARDFGAKKDRLDSVWWERTENMGHGAHRF